MADLTIRLRYCTDCGKGIRTYTSQPVCHPCRAARRLAARAARSTSDRHVSERVLKIKAELDAKVIGKAECHRRIMRAQGKKNPRKRRKKSSDLSTTERGYGWLHQQARHRLLVEFVEGTPCPLCGDQMLRGQPLDCDHTDPASRLDGKPGDRLAHMACNRREGAPVNGPNSMPRRVSRECEVCGVTFVPHPNQRTCSRRCGWVIRKKDQL